MIRFVLILALACLMGCASTVSIYEGSTEEEPLWTIENPPDELTFERTEDGKVEKISMKKKSGGWNPITFLRQTVSDVVALVFGRLGTAQVPTD